MKKATTLAHFTAPFQKRTVPVADVKVITFTRNLQRDNLHLN